MLIADKYEYAYMHTYVYNIMYIPYSGLFLRREIFANFTNRKQFVKILPSKCLLFNRYSLQSMTIRENFPLEKPGRAQFVKIFPLENNQLYGIYIRTLLHTCSAWHCIVYR